MTSELADSIRERIEKTIQPEDGRVDVQVENSEVTLRGLARDYVTFREAARVARQIEGVSHVTNQVEVDPIRLAEDPDASSVGLNV